MRVPPFPGWRRLRRSWAVVTALIVTLGVLGVAGAMWAIAIDHDWGRLPGVPLGVFFTYWLGIAAWRCACLGRRLPAGDSGHTRAT